MQNINVKADTYPSWKDQLAIFARTPSLSTIIQIQSLYGAFDGSVAGYAANGSVIATPFGEFGSDIICSCHSQMAAAAWSKQRSPLTRSYRYEISIPPALHGQDLNYYFYDPTVAAIDPTLDAQIARRFQSYLRRFILGHELEGWPEYSSTGLGSPWWVNITADGFDVVAGGDETDLSRKCSKIVELLSTQEDGW